MFCPMSARDWCYRHLLGAEVYIPCGHAACCERCARASAQQFANCHICRARAEAVAKIQGVGRSESGTEVVIGTALGAY